MSQTQSKKFQYSKDSIEKAIEEVKKGANVSAASKSELVDMHQMQNQERPLYSRLTRGSLGQVDQQTSRAGFPVTNSWWIQLQS